MKKDEALLKRLLVTFRIEAADHISAISSGLLKLEKTQDAGQRSALIEVVFRRVHNLKGAARTVNLSAIESICQSMENIFSILKKQDVKFASDVFNTFHRSLDKINDLLVALDVEGKAPDKSLVQGLVIELDRTTRELEGKVQSTGQEPVREPVKFEVTAIEPQSTMPLSSETIRVGKAKLDSVLLQAEGLLQAKQSLGERASELGEIVAACAGVEKRWAVVRHDVKVIGRFLEKGRMPGETLRMQAPVARVLEFMESGRDLIRTLHGKLSSLEKKMENDHRSAGAMVDSLLDDTKRLSMTPFSILIDMLPRMVRDLLHAQGKEAELVVSGAEIEVDRRILEEMKDPLIHLVRNCVDHGIEKPQERVSKGQPPAGKISVSISHQDSGNVELVVADDGAGIPMARVKTSALKLGILTPDEAERIDEERLLALIFRSGVSTSPLITDLSGRGLGLAIVQEKVERLGGVVTCESSSERGTVFRILLPLTLATLRGLLVRLEENLFIIPSAHVIRTVRVPSHQIRTIEGRETLSFGGLAIPIVHLSGILELFPGRESQEKGDFSHLAILESEDKVIAFKVDEVVNEQEFLVKSLGKQLKRVRNVSGATVLGGGRLAPVLNVSDLMKSAVKVVEPVPAAAMTKREPESKKSILVVEDSVTARALLKNILEAAGYDVKTTIDGIEAYTMVKAEEFDLVVSDVDMPRMNGFELTTKIRSDKKLAELPVVLVTALDSNADRERGIDVGANAYIVKSSFDQSNLLEVISRLI